MLSDLLILSAWHLNADRWEVSIPLLYGGALYGGAGRDTLDDGSGNNQFYANEGTVFGTGTLHMDYRGFDQALNIRGDDFFDVQTPDGSTILKFNLDLTLDLQGSEHDDSFNFYSSRSESSNTIYGNGGNDYIFGSKGYDNVYGGTGNDTIVGGDAFNGYGYDVINGGLGNNIIYETDGFILDGGGNDTLFADYSGFGHGIALFGVVDGAISDLGTGYALVQWSGSIEQLNVTGTQYADELLGGNGDDILDGKQGADIVNGGAGDDTIYSVTGVEGIQRHLIGGAGKDTFVLDVSGNIDTNFNFNTQALFELINSITLKDNTPPEVSETDWGRIGADVAFDVYATAISFVPAVGPALGFLTGLAKTGFDLYSDQQTLEGQIDTFAGVALEISNKNHFTNLKWGDLSTTGVRDTVFIDDFQIGNDIILLPKITDETYSYSTRFAAFGNGDYGVFITLNRPAGAGGLTEAIKDIVFIKNNYTDAGITDAEFQKTIQDLMINGQISRFTRTAIKGSTGDNILDLNTRVSFANDMIYAGKGDDRVYGFYGDDVIQGQGGNDTGQSRY